MGAWQQRVGLGAVGLALAAALALAACEEAQVPSHLAWGPLEDGPSLAQAAEEGLNFGLLATYQPIVPTLRMDADMVRLRNGVSAAARRTCDAGIRACPGLQPAQYQTTRDQVASDIVVYEGEVDALRNDLAASPPATVAAARTFMLAATGSMRVSAQLLNSNIQLRVRTLAGIWAAAGRPRSPAPSPSI